MHFLVTDRLACARCGPSFGLVLFAEELADRRVLRGFLGCSNCRDRYPIDGGFADLRPAPRSLLGAEGSPALDPDPEAALKLAALLGVQEGPGLLLLTGGAAAHALGVAALVPGIEVVAADPSLSTAPETPGVSRTAVGGRLPFFTGSLRGAVLEGEPGLALLSEGVRVLAPGGRLVLRKAPSGSEREFAEAGLDLLLTSETLLVGARK